jgi:SsrA-binding protein
MAKKKTNQPKKISNRRARFDYELGDSIVAGLELTGGETKSLRMGHGHLRGAYVTAKDNELYLINATITGSTGIPISVDEQTRARKLLVKRKEIDHLLDVKGQGRTIVPLELLTGSRYIKLRIAIGKGKKNYDKRHSLKEKDDSRRAASEMKQVQR